jgi:hypothetical protein
MIKDKDSKPIRYDGKEYTYQAIFDFINVYSETFVFKNVEETIASAASKPWLTERVPQLTGDSAEDICLKKEGALCVLYIVKDREHLSKDATDSLYTTG